MQLKEDYTYREMVEKSAMQWLEETIEGDDLVNKHGAKLTKEYIESLHKTIKILEDKNKMKDEFLIRLKNEVSKAHQS